MESDFKHIRIKPTKTESQKTNKQTNKCSIKTAEIQNMVIASQKKKKKKSMIDMYLVSLNSLNGKMSKRIS